MPVESAVEEAYYAALSRPPSATEKERILAMFSNGQEPKRALFEDTYWALLSSKEFLFNH